MLIQVFNCKATESSHGFDNKYLSLEIVEMNPDGTPSDRTHHEVMVFNDDAKKLSEYLAEMSEGNSNINDIKEVIVCFNQSGKTYTLNNIAQLELSLELFSFMWDMKSRDYNPMFDATLTFN